MDRHHLGARVEDLADLLAEVKRLRALTTVDDAMVERAARALYLRESDWSSEAKWDRLPEFARESWRKTARAVLEAALGTGEVAYLKSMSSDELMRIFPQAPKIESGLQLFTLLSADGAPILVTDSREAATANAWEHDLRMVSVH